MRSCLSWLLEVSETKTTIISIIVSNYKSLCLLGLSNTSRSWRFPKHTNLLDVFVGEGFQNTHNNSQNSCGHGTRRDTWVRKNCLGQISSCWNIRPVLRASLLACNKNMEVVQYLDRTHPIQKIPFQVTAWSLWVVTMRLWQWEYVYHCLDIVYLVYYTHTFILNLYMWTNTELKMLYSNFQPTPMWICDQRLF